MAARGLRIVTIVLAIIAIIAVIVATYFATRPPPPAPPVALKVAMIMPGRIDDMAWNQAGYESFMRLKGKLGPEIEIAWVEGVYDPADIVPALNDYAEKGYKLIIGHGFQFQVPIKEVAPDYPDVSFLVIAGFEGGPNYSYADVRTDETGYLFGVLAAKMTKTSKIGYVAGLEVAELARYAKGYELGAKSVNPKIDIRMAYVGNFHDVAGAKETAMSMADAGVDVISVMGDGVLLGATAGGKEKGVYVIGNGCDISSLAPENVLTSGVWRWDAIMEEWINDYKAGIRGNKGYWANLANKGLTVAPFHIDVPEDLAGLIGNLKDKIIAGEITTGGP